MDDVCLRTQQIGLNLSILSDMLSRELPSISDDLNRQSMIALNTAHRLWDVYIPILDFMVEALLELSQKTEAAAQIELHKKYANSQALGNLEGETKNE